ncbi:unnamed protein product [Danaus chrysippus]|uniref:(African queen) hypothetical protein n=1 Tax=Danaus chrysippus TaxID=151541 RepID=A0A8J2WC89_9NEOP|nr:unnamed protein product [Danaus chrysippus]
MVYVCSPESSRIANKVANFSKATRNFVCVRQKTPITLRLRIAILRRIFVLDVILMAAPDDACYLPDTHLNDAPSV